MKRSGKAVRNSFRPYALYYLTKLMAKVPMSVYLGVSQYCTKKMTMTLSNVAGPKTPLVYEGIECRKMAILPPVIGLVPCGFSIISIGENVKIGIQADEKVCDKPEEILKFFNEVKNQIVDTNLA